MLLVSPLSIVPMIHGGAVRIGNLMRALRDEVEIHALVLSGGTDDPDQRAALGGLCHRVYFHHLPTPADESRPDRPGPRRSYPSSLGDRVAAIVQANAVDLVVLEHTECGQLAGPGLGAPTVLTELDIDFRTRARQRALLPGNPIENLADRLCDYRFEMRACDRVDQVHAMSEVDAAFLAEHLRDRRARIRVIPNGVDTEHFRPPIDPLHRRGALFLGSFPHRPNLDAVHYLVREVWPLVRRRLPDASLTIAGARPPSDVLALGGRDGITVVGEVPDPLPLYQSHRVLVAPIRAGTGTRLKILEALASGLPVVSTTLGAEGIDSVPGRDLLLLDSPEELARGVADLLAAPDEALRPMAEAGRRLVEERYDWRPIAGRLHGELLALAAATARQLPSLVREEERGREVDDLGQVGGADITVVIPVAGDGALLPQILGALRGQAIDRQCHVLCVTLDQPTQRLREMLGPSVRVVRADVGGAGLGAAFNLAAQLTSARVLVLLGERAIPYGDWWLRSLAAPLFLPHPPAAVQGAIHARFRPDAMRHDPRFTRETQRWVSTHGCAFSYLNAAVRSAVLEQFPFPPGWHGTEQRWHQLLVDHLQLVLPCWEATVTWEVDVGLAALAGQAMKQGAAARARGERYSLGDLTQDLRHGRPYLPDPSHPELIDPRPLAAAYRHFGVLRPLALYAGNHLNALIRMLIAVKGGRGALHRWDTIPPGEISGRAHRGSPQDEEPP